VLSSLRGVDHGDVLAHTVNVKSKGND